MAYNSLLDENENVSNDLRNRLPDLPTSFANPRRGSALCSPSSFTDPETGFSDKVETQFGGCAVESKTASLIVNEKVLQKVGVNIVKKRT